MAEKKRSEWGPFDGPSPHSTARCYATITSGSTYTTEVKSGLILRVHHDGEDIRTGSGDDISWTGSVSGATDLGWPRGRTCGRRQIAAMESASIYAAHTHISEFIRDGNLSSTGKLAPIFLSWGPLFVSVGSV